MNNIIIHCAGMLIIPSLRDGRIHPLYACRAVTKREILNIATAEFRLYRFISTKIIPPYPRHYVFKVLFQENRRHGFRRRVQQSGV